MDNHGKEETKISSFARQKTVQTPHNGKVVSSSETQKLNRDSFSIPDVEIVDVLGEGGMGVVYKGRQTYIDRDVAIKIMKPVEDSSFQERFKREAKILAGLSHPNIVACYHAGVTNGHCYIVMEFIKGIDLHQYIKQHGALSEQQALYVIKSLANALEYAQEQGIMHRDIKCENVLLEKITGEDSTVTAFSVDFPYRVKLVDLGLAKGHTQNQNDDDNNITQEGNIVGTPSNMAPEQFNADDEVDYRADIYALGCVFFFMLTAKRAFPGRNVLAIITEKMQGPIPSVQSVNSKTSKRNNDFITQLLASSAKDRPQTYREIIEFCEGKKIFNSNKSRSLVPLIASSVSVICIVITVFFLMTGNMTNDNNSNGSTDQVANNNSSSNATNNTQGNNNTGNVDNTENTSQTKPKTKINEVVWDEKPSPLFVDNYLYRLQGWERTGNWAPSEEKLGITGIGSGTITRDVPSGPWFIKGTIESLFAKDRKYGVGIHCSSASYYMIVQNISSSLSVVQLYEKIGDNKKKSLVSQSYRGGKEFTYKIMYENNRLTFDLNDKTLYQQPCDEPKQLKLIVTKVQAVYFFLEMTEGRYK
ncbi:serine/threonine-protein kinase [Candidatus Uabimicrobium amorphum]|uniref:Protein kinase n=1 Tax=Uabimicrobium amorphum TaxID=2596890 RepID=A0A5S9ISN7_UABAM|nr:serine/threonine-protein kinase [Candidatus Uabimicrobium amorphum]BBM86420.1 protein kinase [Candidatus Uabimicrobium amorphum]